MDPSDERPAAERPWWGEPWSTEAQAAAEPSPPTAVLGGGLPPAPRRRLASHRSLWAVGLALLVVLTTGVGAAVGVRVGEDRAPATTATVVNTGGKTTASVVNNTANTSIEAVAAALAPAVVQIEEKTAQLQGTGSGVVIDAARGYILTNNHVVSASANGGGSLTVSTNDGRTAAAKIIGRDPTADIAVVQVQLSGLTQAQLGDSSKLKVGETVVAFGSPLGLTGSVTSGIVSALDRPVSTQDTTGTSSQDTQATIDAIQTDAAINPGNSGGPLVDTNGKVIGINSAIATAGGSPTGGGQAGNIGVGFAIPINEAMDVATQIIKTGHAVHPVIEASISSTQDGSDGALIRQVTPGGPAAAAGLQPGDVITAVGSQRVVDPDAAIVALRKDHKPGDKITLTYLRNGTSHTTTVTLAASAPSP